MKLSNEGCRTQALAARDAGNYRLAMRWFNTAKARTIGHNKRSRYEEAAERMAELGGFEYDGMDYADDSEVVKA